MKKWIYKVQKSFKCFAKWLHPLGELIHRWGTENFECFGANVYFFDKSIRLEFETFGTKLTFTQPAITCSKLTKETVEQGVKYVQS